MTTPQALLETQNLEKKFEGITAVDGVDLQFHADDITAIIGPNGAGKTTFVNLVAGALSPSGGSVTFKGEDVSSLEEHQRINEGIVRSFQIPQVFDDLTVMENIQASLITRAGNNSEFYSRASKHQTAEAEEILEAFGLIEYKNSAAAELPHGIQKVLDVAISFSLDPAIIFLDEPTSGVASSDKMAVMETVAEVVADTNTGMVFIEHDLEIVKRFAGRVIVLHEGAVLAQGEPTEVLESEEVKTQFHEEGI